MADADDARVWLSMAEAAEYLGVTKRTLHRYISEGLLPAYRIHGSRLVRIRRTDLEGMLREIPPSEEPPEQ